jgi:ferrous iron transport protein B
MGLGSAVGALVNPLANGLNAINCPGFITAIICDVIINSLSFILKMLGFVFGVTLVFGLLEEVGVMARISYVFDNTMSKLGLQGKSIMPFLVSFGCTMGGAAGARVIDNWGQKVLTIALAWAIPCGAAWAVVPMLSSVWFGAGAPLVIVAVLLVMVLHMWVTAKVFGRKLVKKEDRFGMIMELPPYHKPKWGALFRYVLGRTKDTFFRVLKIVLLVSFVFWLLTFTKSGVMDDSIMYKVGMFIEPFTKLFGLGWKTFMAFVASCIGKEGAIGVLSTIFTDHNMLTVGSTVAGGAVANINELLVANVARPEALAFIFAITFNMPCIVALAATYQETHSAKWTAIIAAYYTITSLLLACVAYHIGLLIF